MTEVRISAPINPRLKKPNQCRNCGEWYEQVGARSAMFCDTCSQKREEHVRATAERDKRYREADEQSARQNASERTGKESHGERADTSDFG